MIKFKKLVCKLLGRHTSRMTLRNCHLSSSLNIVNTIRTPCKFCKDEYPTLLVRLENCQIGANVEMSKLNFRGHSYG